MSGLIPTFGIVVLAALLPQTASAANARESEQDNANILRVANPAGSASAPALRGVSFPRAEQTRNAPLRDEELPWCISANDPRCAPLNTGDTGKGPFDGDARVVLSAADTGADAAQLPLRSQSFTPRAGLHPRHGVSHRVERPPRAIEPLL
jgi:hypothetical protein